jgi:DNA-binding Lrp family transcriptional regulator
MEAQALKRIESKTRSSQFLQVLNKEFEFSPRTARAVIEEAREIYKLDKIDMSLLRKKGKIARIVISKEANHGPPIDELPKVEVFLTLNGGIEDDTVRRKQGNKALRQHRILRMTDECEKQGGGLSQEDLADILKVSPRTIRRDIKDLKEHGFIVLTRGIINDIGPSVSHKTRIVRLYLERKTYTEISRISRHSPFSIKRYLKSFKQVIFLHRKGLSLKGIAYSINISKKLAKEYLELYNEFNTPEYQDRLIDLLTVRTINSKKKGIQP